MEVFRHLEHPAPWLTAKGGGGGASSAPGYGTGTISHSGGGGNIISRRFGKSN